MNTITDSASTNTILAIDLAILYALSVHWGRAVPPVEPT